MPRKAISEQQAIAELLSYGLIAQEPFINSGTKWKVICVKCNRIGHIYLSKLRTNNSVVCRFCSVGLPPLSPNAKHSVECIDCGEGFDSANKGNVRIRCRACASNRRNKQTIKATRTKRLDSNPIKPCQMCGSTNMPDYRITRHKFCNDCKLIRKESYEVERRSQLLNNDPLFDRRRDLWKKYKLTLQEFDDMFEAQGMRCLICNGVDPKGKGHWHIDHNHITKKVRGILCHHCNIALGHLRDDPERCDRAAAYLRYHDQVING
jgi:hypothetical protein